MNTFSIQVPISKVIRVSLLLSMAAGVVSGLTGCKKEEELAVDRVVSPVLITVSGGSFAVTEAIVLNASVFELDKSGLLNHEVGIDSIPLANLPITLSVAGGAKVADLTTDAQGRIALTKTWAELGLATPAKGNTVNLEWAGRHKAQSFLKQSKVQVK